MKRAAVEVFDALSLPVYNLDSVQVHGNCPDGMGSLLCGLLYSKIVDKKIDFVFLFHNKPDEDYLKNIDGKNIVVFDFSFNEKVIEQFIAKCGSFHIYDHHIGQKDIMAKFPNHCTFDNDRSGVHLAWDFFFPDIKAPKWVKYIQERDLGHFDNTEAMKFGAFLYYDADWSAENWLQKIYPNLETIISTHKNKDTLFDILEDSVAYEKISMFGGCYLKAQEKMVNSQLKKIIKSKFCGILTGVGNFVVSISDTSDAFLKKNPEYSLVLIWRIDIYNMKYEFSLRSRDTDNIECFKIAKMFGGGGHKCAAGFKVDTTTDIFKFLITNISNEDWKNLI